MASELLMEISKDERERAHLRSRKMFETDRISNLLTAEARGRKLEKAQILELINKGVALDEIKKILSEGDPQD